MDSQERESVYSLLCDRTSCRAYDEREIDDAVLERVLDVALSGASGCNLQPFSIIVVRNAEKKALFARLCGQPFISKAPVNLMFVMDWHKLAAYAAREHAPFACNLSCDDNLMAYADIVCAMQRIEIAASLEGLGCCFVGNILGHSEAVCEVLALPDKTYPMLLMTLGYSQRAYKRQPKLPRRSMIFNERYDTQTEKDILAGFDEKYAGLGCRLATATAVREAQLAKIQRALTASYETEKANEILKQISKSQTLNEMQRRFSLINNAAKCKSRSDALRADLQKQGICF